MKKLLHALGTFAGAYVLLVFALLACALPFFVTAKVYAWAW